MCQHIILQVTLCNAEVVNLGSNPKLGYHDHLSGLARIVVKFEYYVVMILFWCVSEARWEKKVELGCGTWSLREEHYS